MKPKCKLIGEDGNIFNLCGIARRVLKREKMYDEADEMADRVVKAESYDDALSIIGEYVDDIFVVYREGYNSFIEAKKKKKNMKLRF